MDASIDAKMARTRHRATVTGNISPANAGVFGILLGIVGFSILSTYTNALTVLVGVVGVISYVLVYGYFKRRTRFATEIGTISGATPILAGYTAVNNEIDLAAVMLFLIMVTWQIPHFYAISIFRKNEYKKAKIPVVSITKGLRYTKRTIIIYIGIYTGVIILTYIFSITGWIFLIGGTVVGLWWLLKSSRNFESSRSSSWAKKSFAYSLTSLLLFTLVISADAIFT